MSGYIRTVTGRKVYPLDPHETEICLTDIAHALSMMPRWGGHTLRSYSVAMHSLVCADIAEALKLGRDEVLACLMHDATEAYLLDLPKPLKDQLPGYKEAENRLWETIRGALQVPRLTESVHAIDAIVRYVEAESLMSLSFEQLEEDHGYVLDEVRAFAPGLLSIARLRFLKSCTFRTLPPEIVAQHFSEEFRRISSL